MLTLKGPRMEKRSACAKTFGDILQEIENFRGSSRIEYQMRITVPTGELFDKGRYPFQDFDLLFSIRNKLMPGEYSGGV
jgi:hypothetical protein